MPEHEASRTLVKSTPELWAECSDAAALARHLGTFGEIRITRLEPETAVAWEGDEVRGTVTLEPSGWGTRVVLTAVRDSDADDSAESSPEPESSPELEASRDPDVSPFAEEEAGPEWDEAPEALSLPPLTPSVVAPSPPRAAVAPLAEPTRLMRILSRLGVRVRWPVPPAVPGPEEDLAFESLTPEAYPEPGAAEPELEPVAVEPEPMAHEPDPEPAPDPVAVEEPVAEEAQSKTVEEPEASEPELEALISALDSLGTPRRRPFSRA